MKVFHLTATKYALMALRKSRLKVARIHDLNDPFELFGSALPDRETRRKLHALKDWAAEKYGILCFSRSWRNPVLWSHYADRHRGVALEFCVHDDDISPVNYTPKRVLLDVAQALKRGTFSEDEALSLATTKFKHWKYEDEVRVFCALADCPVEGGLMFEPFTERMELVGLIRGPACVLSNEDIAMNLPEGCKLEVTQARLAFNSFSVVRNREHAVEVVCGTAQQGVPVGRPRLRRGRP